MDYTPWTACLLDYNRSATEFTGDDVDRFSALVCFDKPYQQLLIYVPTIESAALNIYVQMDNSTGTAPLVLHHGQMVDTGGNGAWTTAAWTTTASTGAYYISCPLNGHQFFRIYTSQNQTADRTFYVRGVNP